MMIGHKSFHIFGQFNSREETIKLRCLWNSVYFLCINVSDKWLSTYGFIENFKSKQLQTLKVVY